MNKFIQFLSRRDWAIFRYNSIFRNLTALLYLCIASQGKDFSFLINTALFFLFSTIMTAYGYFVNDLADIDIDRKHGKSNAFLKFNLGQSRLIVIGILILGLLFALPFINDPIFDIVLILWVFMSSFYSLRPIRFKERGVWGLTDTIVAEYTLPMILLFAAFHQAISWAALFFTLYSTIRGTSAALAHQLEDWSKDITTNTTTFAVRKGYGFVRNLYAFALEIERIVLGVLIGIFMIEGVNFPVKIGNLSFSLLWPLGIIYLVLLFLTIGRSYWALKAGRLEEFNPYDEVRQLKAMDALHLIHHSLPSVLLPLYLACVAALNFWPNLVFVLLIVLIFRLYRPEFLAKINPRNFVRQQ